MADFEPGTSVVVKDTPTLLGIGQVIPTPGYSDKRLTWAKFPGGTEAAFEPGELEQVFAELSLGPTQSEMTVKLSTLGVNGVMSVPELHEAIMSLPGPSTDEALADSFELVNPPSDRAHFAGSTNCGPDCCEAR